MHWLQNKIVKTIVVPIFLQMVTGRQPKARNIGKIQSETFFHPH